MIIPRKVLQFLSKLTSFILHQVYASPRYLLVFICCAIALVVAPPVLAVLHVVVLYLQFDTRNDPYEIVAQLKLYGRLLSYAYMVLVVVCVVVRYVAIPAISEQDMLIEMLITYWLDTSIAVVMILFMCDLSVGLVLPKMLVEDTYTVVRLFNCAACGYLMLQRLSDECISGLAESAHYRELFILQWCRLLALLVFGQVIIVSCSGVLGRRLLLQKIPQIVNNQNAAAADANSALQYRIAKKLLHGKYLVYYAKRLRIQIEFITTSAIILYAWRFYFGWHIIKITTAEEEESFWQVDLAYILLNVWSLLGLVKKCHRLSREARTVYNRFGSRIIKAGKELYFLGILGRHTYDVFDLRYKTQAVSPSNSSSARMVFNITPSLARYYMIGEDDAEDEWGEKGTNQNYYETKLSMKKRQVYKNLLFLHNANRPLTLDDMCKASQCFLEARGELSKKTYTSDILSNLRTFVQNGDGGIREKLKQLVNGKINPNGVAQDSESREGDWDSFEDLLKTVDFSQDISLAKVKTWMERAHNNCLSLANLLHSAMEDVGYLDKIFDGVILIGCSIAFLLLSEIVDTRQLSPIASHILALAFVFGDTCKAMFQGMVFIYMVHPFDVGDLCVLDNNMVVVKSFDIWKTTFTMVDNVVATGEEVIYPNSELAGKKVINHKTEFDWSDCVELNVPHSVHGHEINKLKGQIENHLDNNEDEYTPDSYSIEVSSMENNSATKIAIHLKYNGRNIQDWTYIECLRRKKKLNWNFQLYVYDLVKELIESKTPQEECDMGRTKQYEKKN